jgi:hypothetical protein
MSNITLPREVAKQATPAAQLMQELLDSRVPKTDREHFAAREIERLTARVAELEADALRAGWMAERVFMHNFLTIEAGCGCCGSTMEFPEGTDWRTAVDAARNKT